VPIPQARYEPRTSTAEAESSQFQQLTGIQSCNITKVQPHTTLARGVRVMEVNLHVFLSFGVGLDLPTSQRDVFAG